MRLSVDIHSAVRFRNAEALRGDNLGYMSRISQASQERPKTSRKAAAEERSDDLPLRDVYNEWNGLDLECTLSEEHNSSSPCSLPPYLVDVLEGQA